MLYEKKAEYGEYDPHVPMPGELTDEEMKELAEGHEGRLRIIGDDIKNMICIGYTCDKCKHEYNQLFDGWKPACDAFPDGIPGDLYFEIEPTDKKECNNGIGFELKG